MGARAMRKLAIVLIALALAWVYDRTQHGQAPSSPGAPYSEPSSPRQPPSSVELDDAPAARAPRSDPRPNAQFESDGIVEKVLPDDLKGSRHQRFIVRLPSGRTVLIAHNIDLAPRVANLQAGDSISFSGEFEANDKGGVVHWTHRDPAGRHVDGWIRHQGQIYQ